MKLPNGQEAFIDVAKLRDYCLNPDHPKGKHKARVFNAALGLTANDAERLREVLLGVARTHDAQSVGPNDYGRRYNIEFKMLGPRGEVAVRCSWIIRDGEEFPRLTSCYVV
jgi:hypothetical protein